MPKKRNSAFSNTKRIGGRIFVRDSEYNLKRNAVKQAKRLRKLMYRVRVIPIYTGFYVVWKSKTARKRRSN